MGFGHFGVCADVWKSIGESLRTRSSSESRRRGLSKNELFEFRSAEIVPEVFLGRLGRPPLAPSWPPTSPSWRALGRSWDSWNAWDALGTLLGRSLTLLAALGRSWDPLGTLLARFRDLQGWILASPRRPQRYFKRILSNPSARKRTFRKSTESCSRTVREESENQIHQRCTANSLLDFLSPRS